MVPSESRLHVQSIKPMYHIFVCATIFSELHGNLCDKRKFRYTFSTLLDSKFNRLHLHNCLLILIKKTVIMMSCKLQLHVMLVEIDKM